MGGCGLTEPTHKGFLGLRGGRSLVAQWRGYTHFLPGEVPEWPNGAPC
jgi:hypothetical protein